MFGGDKLYEIIFTSEFKHATVPRTCRSYLGEQILKEYGNGELLPQPMSRLARAAKRDGLDIQMIETLANLGTENCHYPDVLLNCARDTGKLLDDCGVADHVTPTDGPHFKWCVPPTEVVRLVSQDDASFKKHLCPSKEACTQFWRDFLSTEEGLECQRRHPHLKGKTVSQLSTTIPCRVHEDAGPFTKTKSVNTVQWSSILGRGIDLETKYHAPSQY